MSPVSPLDAFPRRPLAVRLGWRARLAAGGAGLIALAALVGAVWFAVLLGPGLLRDARLSHEGVAVPVTRVAGSCRVQVSWLPLAWCAFDVSHPAATGPAVTRSLSALTIVGIDSRAPPVLKVDPNDPDAASLNWLADELPLRWLALLVLSGGLALLAAVVGAGAWTLLREVRLYRSLARAPNPVAARVSGVRLVSSPGWARELTFRYRAPDGAERTDTQRLKVLKGEHGVPPETWTYETPIPLSARGDIVLALAGERGARLVKSSFEPLVLTDEEKERLRSAEGRTLGLRR